MKHAILKAISRGYLIFIYSLLINMHSKGQSSLLLDEKNGFKDIKLGEDYSKWQSDLELINSLNETEKVYRYTGVCCQEVFDITVEKIEIIFSKDKIVYIGIYLKPFQDNRANGMPAKFRYPNEDFNKLVINFKTLFGESKEGITNENIGLMYSKLWEGMKVVLISDYYFKGSYDFVKLTVLDKIYYKNKRESGF